MVIKGIFNVTSKNKKSCYMKSITDEDGFIQITIPPGAYEIESFNNEIKWNITDEGHFTEANYPFTIKPIFLTLESIIKTSPQGPIIGFIFDDSIRDRLGFHAITLYEKYNQSYKYRWYFIISKYFHTHIYCSRYDFSRSKK